MVIEIKGTVKPDDMEHAVDAVADHGLHATKAEGDQSYIFRDVVWDWAADCVASDGLVTHSMAWRLSDLIPRHLAQSSYLVCKRGFIVAPAPGDAVRGIDIPQAEGGLLAVEVCSRRSG